MLILAACGTPAADDTPPTTAPQETTTTTPAATTVPAIDPDEYRSFDVDGALVMTRSALTELPERATVIEVASMLIDSVEGPELCLGAVIESLPPQCSGPVVDGLDFGDWSETASGVTWGQRTVTLAWPPDDRLELVSERAYDPVFFDEPRDDSVPADCADIESFTPVEELAAFADANPDRTDVVSVRLYGSVGVLRITGDRDEIAAELSDGETEPCLIEVEYSATQLRALYDDLSNALATSDTYIVGAGSSSGHNRVTLEVVVADLHTIRQIVEIADDPGMLRITGTALILEGE
jgi:hypothetical protein